MTETIRYFLWPAAFLLALVFVDVTETANGKSMAMTLYKGEPDMLNAAASKSIAPESVHTASPKGILRQPVSNNKEKKI